MLNVVRIARQISVVSHWSTILSQSCCQPEISDQRSACKSDDGQIADTPFEDYPEDKVSANEDRELNDDFPTTREKPKS